MKKNGPQDRNRQSWQSCFFLVVAGFAGLLLILVDAVLLPLSLAWDVGIEPTDNVVGPPRLNLGGLDCVQFIYSKTQILGGPDHILENHI